MTLKNLQMSVDINEHLVNYMTNLKGKNRLQSCKRYQYPIRCRTTDLLFIPLTRGLEFKIGAHCIHPVMVVDDANMQIRTGFRNEQCEMLDYKSTRLTVNRV